MLANFDRSTANHGTQNIQIDCNEWFSGSFSVHRIRFRPGLGLCWGAYNTPSDPIAGLTAGPKTLFLCVLKDNLFTPEDELYWADGQM